MDEEIFVELEKDFLIESCYWIVSKFREDDFHHQQTLSRRDLIGGFFDRWINKTHELLIFDKLIKKDYSVVNDTFFYGQGTKKDAPDVIGLKDKNGKKFPFALFDNGSWELQPECPHVEVKTFRSNQYLVTIPKNQYDDNHYYVLLNSCIRSDYLLSLFDVNQFFNEKYYNNILNNSDKVFLKNENDKKLIRPSILEENKDIGKYELLGIFKGEEIKKYSQCLGEGKKPWYLSEVTDCPRWNDSGAVEPFELNTGFYIINENSDKSKNIKKVDLKDLNNPDEIGIPFYIEIPNRSNVKVKKIIKSAIDIEVKGNIEINGVDYDEGMHRLNLKKFNRSGNKVEYVSLKTTLKYCANSSKTELIDIFDSLYEKYLVNDPSN